MTDATTQSWLAFAVDDLAQEIRRVDGDHSLGAGALAEALMPFLCRTAPPATGSGEAVAWRGQAEGIDDVTLRPGTRDDWIKYGRTITPLYAAPVAGRGDREQVARIIDPEAFGPDVGSPLTPNADGRATPLAREAALAKADRILALSAPPSVAGVEGQLPIGTPVEVIFPETEVGAQTLYVAGVTQAEPGMVEPEYWLSDTWPLKSRGDVSTDWKRESFTALASTAPQHGRGDNADLIAEYLRFVMKTLPCEEAELASRIDTLAKECASRITAPPPEPDLAVAVRALEEVVDTVQITRARHVAAEALRTLAVGKG